jgi:hypothetical protein
MQIRRISFCTNNPRPIQVDHQNLRVYREVSEHEYVVQWRALKDGAFRPAQSLHHISSHNRETYLDSMGTEHRRPCRRDAAFRAGVAELVRSSK